MPSPERTISDTQLLKSLQWDEPTYGVAPHLSLHQVDLLHRYVLSSDPYGSSDEMAVATAMAASTGTNEAVRVIAAAAAVGPDIVRNTAVLCVKDWVSAAQASGQMPSYESIATLCEVVNIMGNDAALPLNGIAAKAISALNSLQ